MKVILRLTARPDKVEELKAILLGLLGPTRKEDGCIAYEVLQSTANPCELTCVEEWRDEAALNAHRATAHVADAFARGGPLLAASPDDRSYSKIA